MALSHVGSAARCKAWLCPAVGIASSVSARLRRAEDFAAVERRGRATASHRAAEPSGTFFRTVPEYAASWFHLPPLQAKEEVAQLPFLPASWQCHQLELYRAG